MDKYSGTNMLRAELQMLLHHMLSMCTVVGSYFIPSHEASCQIFIYNELLGG